MSYGDQSQPPGQGQPQDPFAQQGPYPPQGQYPPQDPYAAPVQPGYPPQDPYAAPASPAQPPGYPPQDPYAGQGQQLPPTAQYPVQGQYPQQPPYGQPQYGQPQYGQPAVAPAAPAKKTGLKIAVIAGGVAVLCLLGCVAWGVTTYLNPKDEEPVAKATTATPSPKRTSPTPKPSPTKSPEWDPKVKDCVKNTGTDADPNLVPATCGPGTYKIVARVPNTTDPGSCKTGPFAAKEPYDATYWYRSGSGIYRYVLCLKKQ